jgi:hypothetical protein
VHPQTYAIAVTKKAQVVAMKTISVMKLLRSTLRAFKKDGKLEVFVVGKG